MKLNTAALTAILTWAALAAGTASAAPVTANPGSLTGNGQSSAIFAYKDAGDTSTLTLASFASNPLFNNQTSAVGSTVNLGVRTGTQVFTLNNLSQGYSFQTGVADTGTGGDGFFHAIYSTNFASFGVGALPTATANAIAALPAGSSVIYVSFEDRRGGDYDYNDLIFAFSNQTVGVPEPVSMALVGVGLLGLGLTRRRRG